MFDIGFSEILLVAVVALVVIGPERLPGVARNIGQFAGRLQRYVHDVKRDFNREVEFEEIRRLQQEMETTVQSMQASMKAVEDSLQQEVKPREEALTTTLEEAQQSLDDLRSQVERLEQGPSAESATALVADDVAESVTGAAKPIKPRKPRVSRKPATVPESPVAQPVAPAVPLAAKPDDDQYRLF